ncbi:alpha-amylase family glycosyl hydrolase [Vibrio coralliilyticus]|uniref:alpha-amylase family glycosyl hydrolase n=1 Tax=Vibrio coralliilyticus TaxID=190893 RepID=UPI0006CD0B97|nr:alpha-amylase family glycosyl hydrolase [Vibrio coralliilyticus]AXN33490.1 alpha-amylase [Vibrio coralliilyticus]KPH23398.1 alpha-amylase [Vibrio coralliilyticus]
MKKYNIYQVFTRLFGNTNTTNQPWGNIDTNGVGKFSHFTEKALNEIRDLGITHIWFTGVPHHALVNDYTHVGIDNDHPSVVKGRAGSPYAVKDYYSVNPDLADDPSRRNQEFDDLISRTHNAGLKVIIDIVPNHVARVHKGLNNPSGVEDFGAHDDTNVCYHKDNNFYYIPDAPFELPSELSPEKILGGDVHPQHLEMPYQEFPAKWTGNGSRKAQPSINDWYETVRVNYGVRPDGSKDFPILPEEYRFKPHSEHHQFWQDKSVPDSWKKFRDIALYWLEKGVDGFRYDMAEMVPVEFWSYLNSSIKMANQEAFLMAEVYQPELYRDYIQLGKMDYLYDKVDLYDQLKSIIQGHGSTREIGRIEYQLRDIEHHMLHFLDNHDEQRLASPEFAGCAQKGKPAMLVSTCLSSSPSMIYFGQEVGEPGAEFGGFGTPSRTSIFDYVGVPHHQRWMNHGAFDGGQLSEDERALRAFYQKLLNLTLKSPALLGGYHDLYAANFDNFGEMQDQLFAFARSSEEQKLIVVANFSAQHGKQVELILPYSLITDWQLLPGQYRWIDRMSDSEYTLNVTQTSASISMLLSPLASLFLELVVPDSEQKL